MTARPTSHAKTAKKTKSAGRKTSAAKTTKSAAADKLDLFKEHKDEYVMAKKPVLVVVRPAAFLTVAGRGAPGGEAFQTRIGALYGAAFTIKMTSKFAGRDYKVCPLEGLWWGAGGDADFFDEPRDEWNWKLLIRTPGFITKTHLSRAVAQLLAKGKGAEVADVRLEKIAEGRCVQMLHVGPYDREAETIAQMKAFAEESDLAFHGVHHEIYLSDPRRVEPARLRTILRQPVK